MRNPKALIEDTFEPIRRKRDHGPHIAKFTRGLLPRCNGKNTYRTSDHALTVRSSLLANGSASYLRVYRCNLCPHWHLTHKKPK